jgi:hypothetical protein
MITFLKENQIFVFGSNLAGRHAGGAALYAKEHFGAEEGIGEGLTGQCYAFPTLGFHNKRSRRDLETSVYKFFDAARKNPEKEFLMTTVGTGIAGYSHEEMKTLFVNPPENVVLPED